MNRHRSVPITVNRSSPIPLYFQIAQQFEHAIRHGELAPGEKLISETELAEELRISRPTTHRAYSTLIDKGLLTQGAGIGTYVS